MKTILKTVLIIVSFITLSSCDNSSTSQRNVTPQQAATPNPTQGQTAPTAEEKTIVQIASEDLRFTTLVAAVVAADLAATLSSDGPFTVLAPTNDAFAKLPSGTIDFLLKPENKDTLANILLYHVISGNVEAKTVISLDGQMVKTASGKEIMIKVINGKVMINDSQVIITDIKAKNGIIHVIDTVLIP